ncbi:DGQHR domain-containing protein [Nocardia higoensis]|uniref:DGQHR domain-containing protein n=1 Tax=Nocardia higoensis TaxID=228599 RepID=A0ABS0DIG2_9NOCA|nr:DGQHR domain-containing protein [Nocardia higoensis]MBF6358255.1 DGQHR domain-containing protein [Nocardia higoensis]
MSELKSEKAASKIRLQGAVIVQSGRPMLLTAIRAEDLGRHKKVDVFDPSTKKGYQRTAQTARVNSAAKYYGEKGGWMPNPLLVNIREEDFSKLEIVIEDDQEGFEEARSNGGDWIGVGYIEIPEDLPIWVYDGQHRADGLAVVLADYSGFENFPVPLSINLGLTEIEEMTEFYEVNTNAKSVRTDLAWSLLKSMADEDPELADRLEMEGRDWITRGQTVVEELEALGGVWSGRIQAPNQRGKRSDKLTIPQAAFVRSLRPLLDMPLLAKAEPAKIAQLLNAYWAGIAQVLPEPFAPANNPKDYAIQKGQGTIALHRVLPQVIEVVRAKGKSLADPAAYAEVMEDLPNLAGEIITEKGAQPVSGAEFWLSGSKGAASQFSGDAGRKRLSVVIRTLLPRPAEGLNF